ncbi:PREDICTED: RNA-binding protein 5-like [Rhagoletis zephyria]|uniref:RNA-binding protein 5-like n=1 Tax=Rhagoletis zephyria TaxID=28612 RepID=UPI0008116E8D|nr:PREDICTED: RNA-binding protein 5-like [Rhagoletis zephyria]
MCVLELHSVLEATQLFHVISSLTTGFVIDDSLVSLAYGPRADTSSVAASSFGSQNAAMAALAAAQWKNLDDSSSKGKQPSEKAASLGSVTVNGVEYPKHATPNYASFQLDATSGYYYDASTGFYYDSSSQYFYNSQTQKYMYYDSANQIYVSVDSAGQATATNMTPTVNSTTPQKVDAIKSSVDDNISKQQDKVKTAKKIAKDMEKWAKTLNQKKEIAKPLTIPQAETVPMEPMGSINFSGGSGSGIISSSPITETVSSVLEKPVANLELTLPATDPIVSAISVDPFEIIRVEEDKRIDWERLVCHLCRRQFGSKEQLEKHKEFSGLHKQNLVALHPSILTEEQLQHVENVERGYRDRARERREKFGFDDTPEFSKKKLEKMKEPVETVSAQALPITDDNVGSKMLKAMGWTEGSGLGKSNQGTADIIQVERRRGGLGLGNNNATFTSEYFALFRI